MVGVQTKRLCNLGYLINARHVTTTDDPPNSPISNFGASSNLLIAETGAIPQ